MNDTALDLGLGIFTNEYFTMLAEKAAPYGYEKCSLVKAVWQGISAMVLNDGSMTNRTRFWDAFAAVYRDLARAHEEILTHSIQKSFAKPSNTHRLTRRLHSRPWRWQEGTPAK